MSSEQSTASDCHRADPLDKATSHIHGYVDRRGPAPPRHSHHEDARHEIVDIRPSPPPAPHSAHEEARPRVADKRPSPRRGTEPMTDRPTQDVVEQQQHYDRHEYRAHDQQAEEPAARLDCPPTHR